MDLTLCDIRISEGLGQSIRDFSVSTLLGVDIDSVQSAFDKLSLHVALSSLQNNSKTWNSTNFSSTLFSKATFYSD